MQRWERGGMGWDGWLWSVMECNGVGCGMRNVRPGPKGKEKKKENERVASDVM